MKHIRTDTQVDKALDPMERVESPVNNTLEAFQKDLDERPFIYEELKRLAMELLLSGREFYSMKSLFEVLRWHRAIEKPQEDFKLNNIFTSWYARKLMKDVPELRGFFRLRKAKANKHLTEI